MRVARTSVDSVHALQPNRCATQSHVVKTSSQENATRNSRTAGYAVSRGFDFRLIVIAVMMAALIAVTARPALAHHSFTMFDQSKTVTLHGTVKDFRWTNPHVFIQLLVKDGQRNEEEWSIEMTSPEHLSRAGWRPGTLKPGDKVAVLVHPLHNSAKGGQYLSGTGPNGPLLGGSPPAGGNR